MKNWVSRNTCLRFQEYKQRMLKERGPQVKEILSSFSYPYNRRIAGAHGRFAMEDFRAWLEKAEMKDLGIALMRLAQLNQSKSICSGRTSNLRINLPAQNN